MTRTNRKRTNSNTTPAAAPVAPPMNSAQIAAAIQTNAAHLLRQMQEAAPNLTVYYGKWMQAQRREAEELAKAPDLTPMIAAAFRQEAAMWDEVQAMFWQLAPVLLMNLAHTLAAEMEHRYSATANPCIMSDVADALRNLEYSHLQEYAN